MVPDPLLPFRLSSSFGHVFPCRGHDILLSLSLGAIFVSPHGSAVRIRTPFCFSGGVQLLACLSQTLAAASPRMDPRLGLEQRGPADRSVVLPRASGITRRKYQSTRNRKWQSIAQQRHNYSHKCGLDHLRATWEAAKEVRAISFLTEADDPCSKGTSQARSRHLPGSRGARPHRSDAGSRSLRPTFSRSISQHHKEGLVIMFNKNTFKQSATKASMDRIPKRARRTSGASLLSAHARSFPDHPNTPRPRSRWSSRTCAMAQPRGVTLPAICSRFCRIPQTCSGATSSWLFRWLSNGFNRDWAPRRSGAPAAPLWSAVASFVIATQVSYGTRTNTGATRSTENWWLLAQGTERRTSLFTSTPWRLTRLTHTRFEAKRPRPDAESVAKTVSA